MFTYQERMANAQRKRRNRLVKKRRHVKFVSNAPFPNYETYCPWRNIPSRDDRMLGAIPKRKAYQSSHTIAPAFNKGPYMVISESCIKDIGK